MRTRYFKDGRGKPTIKALVFDQDDHHIDLQLIDADARKICRRLDAQGHEAYIVGGAVRDLLLGRVPKDFDIATDASPSRVKKLFRNSRIIGKRFRLVHIFFHGGKIHEVATFRAPQSGDRHHIYGTLTDDVFRRDFTLNALYYDPVKELLIDFIGGVRDIRKKTIRSVLPLKSSFVEDPVRMLRAVKYAAMTGMTISPPVARKIKKQAKLLADASQSRLSEELYKIIKSGNAEVVFRLMDRFGFVAILLPEFGTLFARSGGDSLRETTYLSLGELDRIIAAGETDRGVMIRHLVEKPLEAVDAFAAPGRKGPLFSDVFRKTKEILKPLVQPNRDIEQAVRLIYRDRGYRLPRKRELPHPETRPGERERDRAAGAGEGSRDPNRRRRRPRRRKPAGEVSDKDQSA